MMANNPITANSPYTSYLQQSADIPRINESPTKTSQKTASSQKPPEMAIPTTPGRFPQARKIQSLSAQGKMFAGKVG
jgi:hypothetical protein